MVSLHPVILAVPEEGRQLKRRDQVQFLSRHAREAARLSARHSGVHIPAFAKDAAGVPQPSDNLYWSISHKPDYVAGVVAPFPAGIDVEAIRPYKSGLERKIATPAEWALAPRTANLFFRYWTAKEAVLKAVGLGLKGLSACCITAISDSHHLVLEGFERTWRITHHYFPGHLAAVVSHDKDVVWHVVDN